MRSSNSEKVRLKTPEAIEKMRIAGRLAARTLEMIGEYVKPGISTGKLDEICHQFIVEELDAIPAPLNYRGFPKSICTSVNHVVCHGIPADNKILKRGDIVNIDVTVIKSGYHGDTSKMFFIGPPNPAAERLVRVAQECLYLGIEMVKPGVYIGDIGHAIQQYAEKNRYTTVREFCGHGIGRDFHEAPQVLHYGRPKTGYQLEVGACFTIEPMINMGTRHTKVMKDGWTAVTKDRKLSAQWEHTLTVTPNGYEVLTQRAEESFG